MRADLVPAADPVLRHNDAIWSATSAQPNVAFPIQLIGRIHFSDPSWHLLWMDDGNGKVLYLPLSKNPPLLRNGQRVEITGHYARAIGLDAQAVQVHVLDEYESVTGVSVQTGISDLAKLQSKVVQLEAYVDDLQLIDPTHLRLVLVAEGRQVLAWVPPDNPGELPDWRGRFVHLAGVYSGRLDPTGTRSVIEIWVARQRDIQETDSIATSSRFKIPATPINQIPGLAPGTEALVRGRLQVREAGTLVLVRDEGAEIAIQSAQGERMLPGTEVEVLGHTAVVGGRWILDTALFRRAPERTAGPEVNPAVAGMLTTVEAIRRLPTEEAAKGLPVSVVGMAIWAIPDFDFFYLEDLTGGIRVRVPPDKRPIPALQQTMRLEGVTIAGARGPEIVLARRSDLGSTVHPQSRPIALEDALSGVEDGQWVSLHGFFRKNETAGDWNLLRVTGPEGEFAAQLQSPEKFSATPGSLIQLQGVCETTADDQGRITGVLLRVPVLQDIVVEERAPADSRRLPVQPVADLARIIAQQEMTRVRVSGVVVKHLPGSYVVIDDAGLGLQVLSRATEPLVPGDSIGAVGILGREGARIVLREGEYWRLGAGKVPAPLVVGSPDALATALDMRLARVQGRLLGIVRDKERVRLTLQSGTNVFDAVLEPAPKGEAVDPAVRSRLELTGVLQIEFDDARQPRGYQFLLRGPADIAVIEPPHLWTLQRALIVAAILAGSFLLVFVWVAMLRHRVHLQTAQIKSQLAQQASLEAELERGQRFRSLGLLAGGIAHDFNNLLTGILGNATLAMLDEQAMALVGDCLRDIETSAKRARDLTQHLVTFAKGGDPVRTPVTLPELLNGAAGLALSGSKSRADFRYADDLRAVQADRDQLGRALQNLVVHSAGTMPGGGIIAIEAVNEAIGAGDRRALAPGDYVRVTIADRGAGLAADRLPGFFDPYNATKFGDDRFNLAIAYSIVKRHGGHIEVESEVGTGTVFRVWIPAATGPVERPVDAGVGMGAALPEGLAGTRILLMDDEETIRRLGEKMLQRMNCELRLTTHGEECIRAYRTALESGTPFHLVILDLTVPGGLGGKETIVELRKLDPKVRAIVSSGYSTDPVLANFRQHGFRAMVPKPYDVAVLAHAIKDVLEMPE